MTYPVILPIISIAIIFATIGISGKLERHNMLFWLAAAAYCLCIFSRAPALLTMHRLWAETATLYFAYGYQHGPLWALVNPASNYFDLSANVASFAAVLLGLKWWPLVDTSFGYAAALAVPLAVHGAIRDTRTRLAVLAGVAISVCCVSAVETFGTVLHDKGWGAVYAAIAILSLSREERPTATTKALLLLSPFTGTPALFLVSIWACGLAIIRKARLLSPLIYCIPGILTQITFAALPSQSTGIGARGIDIQSLPLIPDLIFVRLLGSIAWPNIFTIGIDPQLGEIVLTTVMLLVLLIAGFVFSARNLLWLLALSAIGIFAASSLLAVGGTASLLQMTNGLRYYFPSVAILLMCAWSELSLKRWTVAAPAAALSLAIVFSNLTINPFFESALWTPTSPSWQDQVDSHRDGKSQTFSIYPPGWTVTLPQCGQNYC